MSKTLTQKQREADIQVLLKEPHFLRFMESFFADNDITRCTFTGNSHSYFEEGRRALAAQVFNELKEVDADRAFAILKGSLTNGERDHV